MPDLKGYFTFVLHSHLPFVIGHGTWPHGTSWLNEATAETYIPILNVINELVDEGRSPHLTIGLTPVLCEMLVNPGFNNEFNGYLDMKIDAAVHDIEEFTNKGLELRTTLAKNWESWYRSIKVDFNEKYSKDIITGFKTLQDKDVIEIITCGATHGYFPLLLKERSIDTQVKVGVKSYRKHFGRNPRGIWLPECAYRPSYNWKATVGNYPESKRKGIEYFLEKHGIQYFFVDTHLLTGGETAGVYAARFALLKQLYEQFKDQYKPLNVDYPKSPYNAYICGSNDTKKPVFFFTRDEKSGIVVWSGEHGYPGDGNYLDFHKKHYPGGHRYWKVTGPKVDLGDKMEYYPEAIPKRLEENASHFKSLVKNILQEHKNKAGKPGIIVSMYDTELFGHWWFEGPQWIKNVLKWMEDDPEIELTTAGKFINHNPPEVVINLPEGSWGQGGWHFVWLNEWTTWTWEKIYECESKMERLAGSLDKNKLTDDNLRRMVNQLGRELLLLQSSDWQFLITTWSARDYAESRVAEHYEKFIKLHDIILRYAAGDELNEQDWHYLGALEVEDCLFDTLEPGDFIG
ncbi:MAG: 1,4-alpha-glucan branching protein domain-containing protein [Promethearchaeota archaeon]